MASSTDFGVVLRDVAGRLRRRSTVFVVSDFISEPGWDRALPQLAQRHDLVAIRLSDPIEQALPTLGIIPLQDAETGEVVWVDSQDAELRQRFADLSHERERVLQGVWAQVGVDCLEIDTQEALDVAFLEFIRLRNPRKRAGGSLSNRVSTNA